MSKDQRIATWVFGSILLVFFIGVFMFAPKELPEFKQRMLAFSSAILAGLFGFFFTGAIHLELKVVKKLFGDLGVKATGGMALFVLVLVWWLSPLAPVTPSLALKAIQFFPENNQISVLSKDVQTILYSFDIFGNSNTWVSELFSMSYSQVVEATGNLNRLIRRFGLLVPENVFYDPTPLHSRDGMLYANPESRQLAVVLFLCGR